MKTIIIILTILLIPIIIYIYWKAFNQYLKEIKNIKEHKQNPKAEIVGTREQVENQIYKLFDSLFEYEDGLTEQNQLIIQSKTNFYKSHKAYNKSFFEGFGVDPEEIEVESNTVMCLMPFHKRYEKIYESVKKSCKKANIQCRRSDNTVEPGNILRQIIALILKSEIIVAVLDGKNANVYYEIGLAHSMGKPVVLLLNNQLRDEVAFNLQSERLILYHSYSELEEKLYNILSSCQYGD